MAVLVNAGARGQTWLTNGLIAYYPLDGTASPGMNFGTTPAIDRCGNPSGAMYFNGAAFIEITNLNNFPVLTLSLWARPENGADENVMCLVTGDDFECDRGLMVQTNASLEIHCGNVCTNIAPTIPFYAWTHFALVYSATNVVLYTNATQVWQYGGPATGWDESSGWRLGFNHFADGHWHYKGSMDEVRIYSRALSATEVQQLYAMLVQPGIAISKAVRLDYSCLSIGTNYQLQESHDLLNWAPSGSPFTATNSSSAQYLDIGDWSAFWRLQIAP